MRAAVSMISVERALSAHTGHSDIVGNYKNGVPEINSPDERAAVLICTEI